MRRRLKLKSLMNFQHHYAKMLNYVLNNELDKNDLTNLQTNLLKQLSNMNQIDLFKLSLEELKAHHEYLRNIKKYADIITRTK